MPCPKLQLILTTSPLSRAFKEVWRESISWALRLPFPKQVFKKNYLGTKNRKGGATENGLVKRPQASQVNGYRLTRCRK